MLAFPSNRKEKKYLENEGGILYPALYRVTTRVWLTQLNKREQDQDSEEVKSEYHGTN
jgi:hypothetical protein